MFLYPAKSIKPCKRNDSNLNKCIIDTVYNLKPLLANGNFGEGFEVPPIEPLELNDVELKRGPQFYANFTSMTLNGASNFQLEKLKANVKNLTFEYSLLLPKLNFTGQYYLQMKILLFDVNGQGPVRGAFSKLIIIFY